MKIIHACKIFINQVELYKINQKYEMQTLLKRTIHVLTQLRNMFIIVMYSLANYNFDFNS